VVARVYFEPIGRVSGGMRALHSSSVGKAMLAWRARPGRESLLRGLELQKCTPKTITTLPRLQAKLEEIRSKDNAYDDQECRSGWRCVGAPIFDQLGNTAVAICLTGR